MSARARPRPRRLRAVLVLATLVALIALALVSADRVQLVMGIGYPERTEPRMLVIAHRGDLDRFPEDTLEAIKAAAAGSADGIEFDAHRSADGVWYVIHDATLDRTTDGTGQLSSLTASEIDTARIDGGLGFQERHRGLRVPRLVEVLEALSAYEGWLVVDLQHAAMGDAGEAARLLEGRLATILVRSPEDVDTVRAMDPALVIAARKWVAPESVDGILMDATTEATIGRVRGAGRPVWVYVDEGGFRHDEAGLIRRAWAANVFAFLSKHPERAAETVSRLAEGD